MQASAESLNLILSNHSSSLVRRPALTKRARVPQLSAGLRPYLGRYRLRAWGNSAAAISAMRVSRSGSEVSAKT